MLDITRTPVARTIVLELKNEGSIIKEAAPSRDRVQLKTFVEILFPGRRIEHLGRSTMANVNPYGRTLTVSSLFFQTVHEAHAWHHALGLRPEVLMYLITSVIAETVRRHPDDYRDLFTASAHKIDIKVRHDKLMQGDADSPWDEAIALFAEALRACVPSRIMRQMVPELSTATAESDTAALIAFMDTAQPYYDYYTYTLCGIPRIVLFGEAADYRRVVIAAKELAGVFQKHLATYFANLLPVLDTIATAAEGGRVDETFWGQIYKHYSASGSHRFSGWISSFLWYVHNADWATKTNPLVVKDQMLVDWRSIGRQGGLDSGSEPTHVASVPFTWNYLGKALPMRFIAGILGVETVDGALTPALSYGVLRAA
jgi:hypothetical protein